jgi:carboxymethylenebutenolidase
MSAEPVRIADEPAYAACPEGATRGVVIIHEIIGYQPEITRVVERFAAQGYAAVAPDLFHKGLRPICIARTIRAAETGQGAPVQQALRARDWLMERAGLDADSVGLIGFCLGGRFALGVGKHWAAVSSNYGGVVPTETLRGIGPTIGCFGERDRVFRRDAPRLARQLEALDVPHEVRTYPGVGHSFLTDGDHPIKYALAKPVMQIRWDPEVAAEAWGHIFDFMGRYLRPTGG